MIINPSRKGTSAQKIPENRERTLRLHPISGFSKLFRDLPVSNQNKLGWLGDAGKLAE